jgi:hypothetical protein
MQSFKFVQNWFGSRGLEVKRSHFKKWLISGDRLYWVPNNKTCIPEMSTDYEGTVNICSLNSLYFEIDNEVSFTHSPFIIKTLRQKPKVKPDSIQLREAINGQV